ncbi:MAG: endonuclease/exonuclease/phosphatase family protein [Chitinophagales bacterium]|nr:endonuclease/exonuclease/phosphatase family protein [Chitinophagales bacterium]
MQRIFFSIFSITLLLATLGCKKDKDDKKTTPNPDSEITFPYTDTLSVLTYNVAGLPEILSSGDPVHNTSEIGRRLNHYSLVAVQEDFNYNHFLYGTAQHPYKTKWSGPVPVGDGLNVLSQYKISDLERIKWKKCNGADCLTPKGFSFQRIEIVDGITIDLYDIHSNAGHQTKADNNARRSNLLQMYKYMEEHSQGRPVIAMGDFNSRYTNVEDTLEVFQQLGLQDTWLELVLNNVKPVKGSDKLDDCINPASGDCETVDRIFYRSSDNVKFRLLGYDKPQKTFQRDDKDLSDHIPVFSLLEVTILRK